MIFLFFWLLFASIMAYFGKSKGHSAAACFFGSLILSPIIVAILMMMTKGNLIKKCPACAEMVKSEANKCKHCRYDFSILTEADRISKIEEESSKIKVF